MPQANQYLVTAKCTYGKPGEVIELEGDLTDRQKVMLKPYNAPGVKKLEVATPSGGDTGKSGKPKTVKELEAEIAVMTDLDALIALSEDERAGVKKAVEARLTELEAGK